MLVINLNPKITYNPNLVEVRRLVKDQTHVAIKKQRPLALWCVYAGSWRDVTNMTKRERAAAFNANYHF